MKYDWKYLGFEVSPSLKARARTIAIRVWKLRITFDVSLVNIDYL